jgi:hypothetical protein
MSLCWMSYIVLHWTRQLRLAKEKHSSLLDPFVSYDENEVLWIRLQMFLELLLWQDEIMVSFAKLIIYKILFIKLGKLVMLNLS